MAYTIQGIKFTDGNILNIMKTKTHGATKEVEACYNCIPYLKDWNGLETYVTGTDMSGNQWYKSGNFYYAGPFGAFDVSVVGYIMYLCLNWFESADSYYVQLNGAAITSASTTYFVNNVNKNSVQWLDYISVQSNYAAWNWLKTDTFANAWLAWYSGTGGNLGGIKYTLEQFATTVGISAVLAFPGENSNTGGGTGTFDITSDDISFPSVPTLSAVSAGFITLFTPSTAQLNSLASFMWSSAFDLDTFKKLFSDPMDAIIGLSIVPVSVPISGSESVKIGFIDTGVSMNLALSQYTTINCGTLTPAEYWGSALDYSPYTKFSIHLPYIGTRELNTDDIMGKAIQVVYNIDILSGACTAMIKCGGSVLYEFSGACAISIPVTGQNWTQLITSCIQLAGAGIAVAASGGSAAGLLPSTANAVMAMKPNIQRTGAVSGSAGMLGVQQPYLIWELPRQSLAKNYNQFVGYPSNITALLSTLTGYTQIESVHLENIPATQTELAEIETLLKEGVII